MKYIAKVGLNYVPEGAKQEVRVEAGEVASGLPKKSIDGLIETGAVYVDESPAKPAKPVAKAADDTSEE